MLNEQNLREGVMHLTDAAQLPPDLLERIRSRVAAAPLRRPRRWRVAVAAAAAAMVLSFGLAQTPVGQAIADGLKMVIQVLSPSEWQQVVQSIPATRPAQIPAQPEIPLTKVSSIFPAAYRVQAVADWSLVEEVLRHPIDTSTPQWVLLEDEVILYQAFVARDGGSILVRQRMLPSKYDDIRFAPGTREITLNGYQALLIPEDIWNDGQGNVRSVAVPHVRVYIPVGDADQVLEVDIGPNDYTAPLPQDVIMAFAEALTAQPPTPSNP
jgi:hypothetical protein